VERKLMELGTFGALIGFAIELEVGAADFYERARRTECGEQGQETFAGLAGQASKHKAMLERARRENVAEMILEPITGLHREDYLVDLALGADMGLADVLARARELEERAHRYYNVAAEKVSLPEVKRIFKRLAARRADNSQILASISPPT